MFYGGCFLSLLTSLFFLALPHSDFMADISLGAYVHAVVTDDGFDSSELIDPTCFKKLVVLLQALILEVLCLNEPGEPLISLLILFIDLYGVEFYFAPF